MYLGYGTYIKSAIYYASVLSGPLLACVCGSFLCLIPIHYVIEYPKYWYEEQTVRFLTCIVIWLCQYASEVINWSNFPMKGKWKTCLFLVILGGILYASVMVAYHFIWTEYLGFFQPMPFNGHLQGFIASTMMNTALWFRWIYTRRQLSSISMKETVSGWKMKLVNTQQSKLDMLGFGPRLDS